MARAVAALVLAALCAAAGGERAAAQPAGLAPFVVTGDAIEAPLGGLRGDPARGRGIIVDRQKGLCLLCHSGPFPDQRFQGDIAPGLAGAGARLSVAQLRLRIVDGTLLNPETVMPSYHRVEGLTRVARAFEGKPILDAQEVEDVVAFLGTLRDEPSTGETR